MTKACGGSDLKHRHFRLPAFGELEMQHAALWPFLNADSAGRRRRKRNSLKYVRCDAFVVHNLHKAAIARSFNSTSWHRVSFEIRPAGRAARTVSKPARDSRMCARLAGLPFSHFLGCKIPESAVVVSLSPLAPGNDSLDAASRRRGLWGNKIGVIEYET